MDSQGPGPELIRNASPVLRAAMADIYQCFQSGVSPSEEQLAAVMNNASPAQMVEMLHRGHDPSHPSASSARTPQQAANSPQVVKMRNDSCSVCRGAPVTGSKLRYCGECRSQSYCSKACAMADWPEHKLVCKTLKQSRVEALAKHQAQGGRQKDFNSSQRDFAEWFLEVPGLRNETILLGWKHRHDSPLIHACSSQDNGDGSSIRVEMTPRSDWDRDISPHPLREGLREMYGYSTFCPETNYVCTFTVQCPESGSGTRADKVYMATHNFVDSTIHCAEIIEALTAATRDQDLVDAFSWIKQRFPSNASQNMFRNIRDQALAFHGSSTPHDSVPASTRAINNEVACMLMRAIDLEIDVRLIGLCGAAHLNDREGIIRGRSITSFNRWDVRLDDGVTISVKAPNLLLIRRGDYRRKSP
mmetsp:Transcript_37707/g.60479  ORF Transcript_37707/g.60479 Transcript_37707/m.60479 type:complete len:417 (+) Transcript_37707:151-1401(+)